MNSIKGALAALAIVAIASPALAADGVATVNGKVIKQSLYDYISKEAEARGQPIDATMRERIVDQLVSSELVYQEAQRLGLDKQPSYQAQEELSRRELLVNFYLQDFVKKNPISESALKSAYDKLKAEMGDKEYKARHILVPTEAEAKQIIAQLGKGGDFAKIAEEKSQDPGSKTQGGDLGWFSPASMVKPFSDATVALKKGAITQTPVQSQFGWHVIKLDDTRAAQPPAYDKVKDNLRKQLQQQEVAKALSALRSKAKIVTN